MPDEIIHVDVVEVREEARPRSAFRRAVWTIFLAAAVFLVAKSWPLLTVVLIASVLLAAVSTAKVARRRALWEARFGRPAEQAGVSTYVRFLAAWFFGIIVAVPLAILVLAAVAVGVVIVLVVAILALIASMFTTE